MEIIKPLQTDQFNRAYSFTVYCPHCNGNFPWYRFKDTEAKIPDFIDLDDKNWRKNLGIINCECCKKK